MKLIVTDLTYAAENKAMLLKERHNGNMVCLYSAYNRQKLKRTYVSLANYFIADSGEFVYSGCYTLHNVRSVYLETVKDILNACHVSYAFRLEQPDACGGQIVYACSDPSLQNDEYTYIVSFADEQTKKAVMEKTAGFCTFHFIDETHAYITFNDISLNDALSALLESQSISSEDVVYKGTLSDCQEYQ